MNSLAKIHRRNINILVVIYAVHKHGSLTRAGEELCMTQPNVSKHLTKARSSMVGYLFERHAIGVTTTEKLTAVMPAIERLIKLSDDIFTALGADSAVDFSLDTYSDLAVKNRSLEMENAGLKAKLDAARLALS